jgi:hypothetical protein
MFRADWTPKTSATYLHHLTGILADTGGAAPGSLPYRIAGQPDTVHDLLLRKADGTYWLIVWNERVDGEDEVELDLGDTRAVVELYDPTVGTAPTDTLHAVRRLPVVLGDHPLVIAIP